MSNIIRVKKDTNYVVMNKAALQDKSLSWKAKGIMAYMLSMPDDWTFYIEELMKHSTDGKSSFRAGFNELKKAGYIKRIRSQGEDGQFNWETIVYEKPHTDFPQVEKPSMEKPRMDNRTLLSNEELSNEELSNDIKIPYVEIVNYLNSVSSKNYKPSSQATKKFIDARWKEGHRLDDFKRVIDVKCAEWLNTDQEQYVRPQTLFGTKFEAYLNQKPSVRPNYWKKFEPEEWQKDGADTERTKKEYADGLNF